MDPKKRQRLWMFLCMVCCSGVALGQPSLDPKATQLWDASRRGNINSLKALLADMVDVNAANEYGVTALSIACDRGNVDVVDALLASGANPNTKDKFYGFSPIGWAVSKKNVAITEKLVAAGATDIDSNLKVAVSLKNEGILRALIASKHATPAGKRAAWLIAREGKDESLAKQLEDSLPEDMRAAPTKDSDAKDVPSKDASSYAELVGEYASDSGTKMSVLIEGNELRVRADDAERTIPLATVETDRFSARGIDITFVRSAGKVVAMKWLIGEQTTIYQRRSESSIDAAKSASHELLIALSADYPLESTHWPNFRGLLSRGIAKNAKLPKEWDGESMKNIAWKTPIPGLGTSSPIVWGNQVFLTTAVQSDDADGFRVGSYGDVESVEKGGECQYLLLCLDLETGKVLWQRESHRAVPLVKRHAKSSHANPTPATNGERVVAFFGNEGVYCYGLDGELLWSKQIGKLDSGWFYDRGYQWGFGSSPVLFEDMVLLQCDVQDGSFVTALDLNTGEERWRTERNEIPTWSSPVAFVAPDGTPVVVVTGTKCSAAYDARSGQTLWTLGGFSEIAVPTPQVTPDLILLTTGYAPVQPIVALKHSARGELKMPPDNAPTDPFVWSKQRGGPYMPTPLIHKNRLYLLDNSGILSGYGLDSGQRLFRQRVRNQGANAYTASPVATDDTLYLTAEIGVTFVVAMDDQGTIRAENKLGESVLASPAISGNKLLIRGEKHLFAISE